MMIQIDRDSKLAILKMFKFATYLDGRWDELGQLTCNHQHLKNLKPLPLQLINQKQPT
jgi:hypothetical protein